jgi:predicted transcriptional regulator
MRKAKTNVLHVSIDMSGNRGRKLDILATGRKASRCDTLGQLIDDAYERSISVRETRIHKGEKEADAVS